MEVKKHAVLYKPLYVNIQTFELLADIRFADILDANICKD